MASQFKTVSHITICLLLILIPAYAGITIVVGPFSDCRENGVFPPGWEPLFFKKIERRTSYTPVMEKHGVVIGWAMAFDRVVRCGRDEADVSPKVAIDGQTYVFDPVSANDFWWFEEEK